MSGNEISFDVHGKSSAGYLAVPARSNAPGVLVLHAWWGLNSFFKGLCDRLAVQGFAAFAPDLNNRQAAKTIEEAKRLMSEIPFEQKRDIVAAAPDFLHNQPEVRKEPLALIGFSMGASWSLVLAGERPEDIRKVVLFYGSGGEDFSRIKAEVLGHYASNDEFEPLADVRAMESALRAAGLQTTFHIYPNTRHWFFEKDRPEYDPQAAELAWTRTLAFLQG